MKTLSLHILLLIVLSVNLANSIEFLDITKYSGIRHRAFDPIGAVGGVAVLDYDNDGLEDLYFTSGINQDKLFRNLGDGKFLDVANSVDLSFTRGIYTNGVGAADIDNDGWTDLFITTGSNKTDFLLINNGNGTFSNISEAAGISSKTYGSSITFLDVNNDGLLDIYVGNYGPSPGDPCLPNVLYVNKGNRSFVDETVKWGLDDIGCTLAVSFTDIDNDGRKEIFVGNDFGSIYEPNKVFKFDTTTNKYIDVALKMKLDSRMNSMGVIGGDYNEDGFYDYYITNIDSNKFYKNNVKHVFEEVAIPSGTSIPRFVNPQSPNGFTAVTSWGGAFVDADHDTYLDLFVANGHLLTPNDFKDESKLLRNLGNGNFEDISTISGFNSPLKSRGFAYFDFDNDGDIDIALCNVILFQGKTDESQLIKNNLNETSQTNWLQVKLQGTYTNRDAIGSSLTFYIGNRKFIKEVHGGGDTFYSTNTLIQHLGMGRFDNVDSIEVRWLDGDKKVVRNINKNQKIKIIQDYKVSQDTAICKGNIFKGRLINSDTSFTNKYIALTKADSLVTYNVKVLQPKLIEEKLEFCEGDLFENQILTGSRVDEKKGTTFYGCDSTYRRIIKVNPAPKLKKVIDLCYGDSYNNEKYFKNAKFIERINNGENCDSLNEVTINVLPTPKNEQTYWICYGGVYNEKKIYKDTTIIQNFTSKLGCDSVFALIIRINPIKKYEKEVLLAPGGEFNGNIYNNDTTLNELSFTADGCDSLSIFRIKILTSVEEDILSNSNFAYPNPFENKIALNLDNLNLPFEYKNENIEINLFDLLGNKIFSQKMNLLGINSNNNQIELNFENLNLTKNSVYILQIFNSKINYKVKLIKK